MKLFFYFFFLFAFSLVFGQTEIQTFLPNTKVYGITGNKNEIWIATYGKGIYKYSVKSKRFLNYSTKKNNLQHDMFYCIAENKNFVWAGSVDGLFIFNKKRKRWSKRKFGKGGQYSNWIRSLEYDKFSKCLWIGRFKYLSKYDIRTRRFVDYDLTVGNDEKSNTIKTIKVDGDTLVWFGTEAGMHKYQKALPFHAKNAVKFFDNRLNYFNHEGKTVSISDLLFEQNNIWIGLDEFKVKGNENYNIGGVYCFNRKNTWKRYDTQNGLNANGVYALEKTGNFIWVSLYQFSPKTKAQFGRGLCLINRITKKIIPILNKKIPDTIYDIYFDGKNIWLGTDRGLIKINLTNKLASWN